MFWTKKDKESAKQEIEEVRAMSGHVQETLSKLKRRLEDINEGKNPDVQPES